MDGVTKTRAGWLRGREVVEVTYDPATLPFEELLGQGLRAGVVNQVFTRTDAQQAHAKLRVAGSAVRTDEAIRLDEQPKYHLSGTLWRHLPLTDLQSARLNAMVWKQAPAAECEALLTPAQLALWKRIQAHPKAGWPMAIDVDYEDALAAAQAVAVPPARK
jgi:Fe-S cluster assembly scaffold protein SufB